MGRQQRFEGRTAEPIPRTLFIDTPPQFNLRSRKESLVTLRNVINFMVSVTCQRIRFLTLASLCTFPDR